MQYASDPEFPWYRLRKESPGVYESYADMEAGAWTTMKIDVTGTNPNVMFELGYVWATSDMKPLLILRHPLDQRAFDALPFYLKPLQIASPDESTPEGQRTLAKRITSFLGGANHPQR